MIGNRNYAGEYLYYLPWYDQENILFIDIARCVDLIFRLLGDRLSTVERNLFLETALENIHTLTRDLGLHLPPNADLNQKRALIQSYLHYLHKQTTEEVVRDLLKGYATESSVPFIYKDEAQDTYKLIVNLFNERQDYDLNLVIKMLEKVLPAHLSLIVRFYISCLLEFTTRSGDHTYPVWKCGEHKTGMLPRPVFKGERDIIHLDLDVAERTNKEYHYWKNLKSGDKTYTKPQGTILRQLSPLDKNYKTATVYDLGGGTDADR